MDSSLKSLKALLELVGIEAISDTQIESVDTLQHLMGVTLQCLGGVRQLIHILEKERLSKVAVGEPDDQNFLGIRDTFVHAATKFLEASSGGFGIVNDLDPAKHLIESFPDEHKLADARWTKIHWAILCHSKLKSPLESIDALVRHDPDTIRELDRENRSMLHYAARMESPALLDVVASLSEVARGGYGAQFANSNGALPLHNTARFGKSFEVYKHMMSLCPDALRAPNDAGTLPLHWASAKNTNVQIVEDLINSFPEAMSMVNHENCLPLHTAAQNTSLPVVQLIFDRDPSAIQRTDLEGGFPLHHACCMNSNLEVVKLLYSAFPEAISIPQHTDGVLPIHLAASRNSSPTIMKFLLEQYPEGALHQDSVGWLPLHCVLNNPATEMRANRLACMKLLLAAHPTTVAVTSRSGQTPYDLAVNNGYHPHVQRLLLRACPQVNPRGLHDLNWRARRQLMLVLVRVGQSLRSSEFTGGHSPHTYLADLSDQIKCPGIKRRKRSGSAAVHVGDGSLNDYHSEDVLEEALPEESSSGKCSKRGRSKSFSLNATLDESAPFTDMLPSPTYNSSIASLKRRPDLKDSRSLFERLASLHALTTDSPIHVQNGIAQLVASYL